MRMRMRIAARFCAVGNLIILSFTSVVRVFYTEKTIVFVELQGFVAGTYYTRV